MQLKMAVVQNKLMRRRMPAWNRPPGSRKTRSSPATNVRSTSVFGAAVQIGFDHQP